MKYYFVLNPKAGKGSHSEELEVRIRAACEKRKIPYEIYMTTGVGDATAFVRKICADEANLPARFYACGGDGTFGEVVNGAVGTVGASVGVIPVGTGNDFVRNFSPSDAFSDIDAQISGEETRIDLLRRNDFYAVNMINIGFDCEVVKKMSKLKKNPLIPSKLAYIAGVIITLIKKPGVNTSISFDGSDFVNKRYLLTTFANGSFCGGGFHSNPYSSLTDRQVDGLLVNNVSRTKFVSLVGSYKKGTHIVPKNDDVLKNSKYEKVVLRFPQTQSASIDGELFDFDELSIECVPSAISVILPAGVSSPVCSEKAETLEV